MAYKKHKQGFFKTPNPLTYRGAPQRSTHAQAHVCREQQSKHGNYSLFRLKMTRLWTSTGPITFNIIVD